MSDEFIKAATQEINEEISHIRELVQSLQNDSDIFKHADMIEKHFHKIKGLAPMMGKEEIGRIAALINNLLKHMIKGNTLEGIYEILFESNNFMSDAMQSESDSSNLEQKIKNQFSNILL